MAQVVMVVGADSEWLCQHSASDGYVVFYRLIYTAQSSSTSGGILPFGSDVRGDYTLAYAVTEG
jgi:hypothetical protein